MPLLYQKRILRQHLRANPGVLFVFGDNLQRKGMKGQALEMRGEPNAVGVATKWRPSMEDSAFFHDREADRIISIIDQDLTVIHEALAQNRIVVWPTDGIGTGLSQLPTRTPKIWAFLEWARKNFESY